MADFQFTDGDDVFVQKLLAPQDWSYDHYYFGAGNDIAKLYTGVVYAAPVNSSVPADGRLYH